MTKANLKHTNTVTPAKQFRAIKTSVADAAPPITPIAPKPRKKSTNATPSFPYAPDASKRQRILALLGCMQGASIAELQSATGWQPHSVRGFLSATVRQKLQLPLVVEMRSTGERVYRIHTIESEPAHA